MINSKFLKSGVIFTTEPGKILIGWGERTWLSKPSSTTVSFYFPDFFLADNKPWFVHANCQEYNITDLLNDYTPDHQVSLQWHLKGDQPLFFNMFDDLQQRLSRQELTKAVPYIFARTENPMTDEQLKKSLSHLLSHASRYPIFVYGFWESGKGMLGGTPELLFKMQSNRLETMACAGTCPNSNIEAFLNSQKDMHEHELVVKGIMESLSSFGHVEKHQRRLLQLSHLSHYVTPITVALNSEVEFTDLVNALHPTPALGAYPKEGGQGWLKNYQTKLPRGRFGAPVGYCSSDEGVCYVAIRNVQWDGASMRIGAGCGVVGQSVKESEWSELQLKIQATQKMLSL